LRTALTCGPLADIRASGCTSSLRKQINSALLSLPNAPAVTRTTYFRPPRESRTDIDKDRIGETLISPQIEVELFDPTNFSPALMIHLLHQLGSPATPVVSARSGAHKPVGVHITALTRTSASAKAGSGGPKPEPDPARPRTVEELYQAQLAIRSAQTHATHHTAYGGITSTVPISRVAVEESGRKEPGERGAPFRLRDDAVMGGGGSGWINDEQHDSARTGTLYAAGLRRFHPLSGGAWVPHERDPYSDDETEAHAEGVYRADEAEAIAAQAREEEQGSLFYQYRYAGGGGVDRRIKKRGERTFGIPEKEEGMLLRLMPYVPPWEDEAERAAPVEALPMVERNPVDPGKRKRAVVPPTPTLTKKRRRDDATGDYAQTPFGTFSGSTLLGGGRSSSSPSRNLVHPAGSSSPSSAAAFPFSPAPSSSTLTNKSVAKKSQALYTPRSDPKNLVKTGTVLPKRSTLAAFRGRR
jgi:hypothetical protein